MLHSPKELKAFLESIGAAPKKSLSQNFLIDGNIVNKIIVTAGVAVGDSVLEIGPGPGVLTEALCAKGATVYAVEKDRLFARHLNRFEKVYAFEEDILSFDLSRLPEKTKVVSNIPYHLTAPILTRLAPHYEIFHSLTLMVQEEVARRLVASPKTKEYGSLSCFMNFYSRPAYGFKVSRNCFYPSPKIDSAVITCLLKKPPQIDEEAFFVFVRAAFQHRRKMIKTQFGPSIGPLLEELGMDARARPEELSLELFLNLFLRYQEKKSNFS